MVGSNGTGRYDSEGAGAGLTRASSPALARWSDCGVPHAPRPSKPMHTRVLRIWSSWRRPDAAVAPGVIFRKERETMEVDARNYPTPPVSLMTRFGRRVVGMIEG